MQEQPTTSFWVTTPLDFTVLISGLEEIFPNYDFMSDFNHQPQGVCIKVDIVKAGDYLYGSANPYCT